MSLTIGTEALSKTFTVFCSAMPLTTNSDSSVCNGNLSHRPKICLKKKKKDLGNNIKQKYIIEFLNKSSVMYK